MCFSSYQPATISMPSYDTLSYSPQSVVDGKSGPSSTKPAQSVVDGESGPSSAKPTPAKSPPVSRRYISTPKPAAPASSPVESSGQATAVASRSSADRKGKQQPTAYANLAGDIFFPASSTVVTVSSSASSRVSSTSSPTSRTSSASSPPPCSPRVSAGKCAKPTRLSLFSDSRHDSACKSPPLKHNHISSAALPGERKKARPPSLDQPLAAVCRSPIKTSRPQLQPTTCMFWSPAQRDTDEQASSPRNLQQRPRKTQGDHSGIAAGGTVQDSRRKSADSTPLSSSPSPSYRVPALASLSSKLSAVSSSPPPSPPAYRRNILESVRETLTTTAPVHNANLASSANGSSPPAMNSKPRNMYFSLSPVKTGGGSKGTSPLLPSPLASSAVTSLVAGTMISDYPATSPALDDGCQDDTAPLKNLSSTPKAGVQGLTRYRSSSLSQAAARALHATLKPVKRALSFSRALVAKGIGGESDGDCDGSNEVTHADEPRPKRKKTSSSSSSSSIGSMDIIGGRVSAPGASSSARSLSESPLVSGVGLAEPDVDHAGLREVGVYGGLALLTFILMPAIIRSDLVEVNFMGLLANVCIYSPTPVIRNRDYPNGVPNVESV